MSVGLRALKGSVERVELAGSQVVPGRQMPSMEEPLDSCACLACSSAMAADRHCLVDDWHHRRRYYLST